MPSIANIVVKANDGTTDRTFTAQSPATPDSPAIWTHGALGATAETRPEFRQGVKRAKDGKGYTATSTFMYPYFVVNSTTGVTSVEGRVMVKRTVTVLGSIPQSTIDEAVSQSANLAAATLPKDVEKQGYGAV